MVNSKQQCVWFTVYSGVCFDLPQPPPPQPRSALLVAVNEPGSCTPADCTAVDSCSSQDPCSSASSRMTLHWEQKQSKINSQRIMLIVSHLPTFYILTSEGIQWFINIQKVCKIYIKSQTIFYNNRRKDRIQNIHLYVVSSKGFPQK